MNVLVHNDIKRVMIVGCSGFGKSTFARKLHSITNIELIYLDQYYWKKGWQVRLKNGLTLFEI
jgi:adenylate kinase family enzyme